MLRRQRLRHLAKIDRFLANWARTARGHCIACDAQTGHKKACAWKAAADALHVLEADARLGT